MIPLPWVPVLRAALFLAALTSLQTPHALAQDTDLAVGTRLRISAICDSERGPPAGSSVCSSTGSLVSLEHDSITVDSSGATNTYAISELVRAEVSDGYRSYRWVGAGIGGAAGLVATHLVLNSGGSTSLCNKSTNQDATSRGVCLGLTALGGLAGAGLGAVVGGLITTEVWREVSLDSHRVGIGVRLRL